MFANFLHFGVKVNRPWMWYVFIGESLESTGGFQLRQIRRLTSQIVRFWTGPGGAEKKNKTGTSKVGAISKAQKAQF